MFQGRVREVVERAYCVGYKYILKCIGFPIYDERISSCLPDVVFFLRKRLLFKVNRFFVLCDLYL